MYNICRLQTADCLQSANVIHRVVTSLHFFNRNFLTCLRHDDSSFLLFRLCHFRFTNDKIFFPQTQIASLSYIGVRTSLFYLAPFDVILSVLIFETLLVFT